MEATVQETFHSLIGMEPLLDEILKNVVVPIVYRLYGYRVCFREIISSWKGNVPAPLKFILLTGARGSGKTAVASVIANELRKKNGEIRQDIRYRNDKVKYLRWNLYGGQEGLVQRFREIVKEAKECKDGRDFTVLHFPCLEMALPLKRRRSILPEELVNLKEAMLKELRSGTFTGKLLIIGETTFPDRTDKEILNLAEKRFNIPTPDMELKLKIARNFSQMQGIEVREPDLVTIASSNLFTTPGELKRAFQVAIERATVRQRREHIPGTLLILIDDFPRLGLLVPSGESRKRHQLEPITFEFRWIQNPSGGPRLLRRPRITIGRVRQEDRWHPALRLGFEFYRRPIPDDEAEGVGERNLDDLAALIMNYLLASHADLLRRVEVYEHNRGPWRFGGLHGHLIGPIDQNDPGGDLADILSDLLGGFIEGLNDYYNEGQGEDEEYEGVDEGEGDDEDGDEDEEYEDEDEGGDTGDEGEDEDEDEEELGDEVENEVLDEEVAE